MSRKAVRRKIAKPRRTTAKPRRKAVARAVSALGSWADVDGLICRLAAIDARADALCADVNRRIQAVKDKAAPGVIRLAAERAALEAEVQAFAKAHKGDFGKDRSLRLAHGRVGWRAASSIRFTAKADEVVAALEERGLDVAVMVTKRPSKEVLDTFDDALLARLPVTRRRTDKFYIDLDEAHLARP